MRRRSVTSRAIRRLRAGGGQRGALGRQRLRVGFANYVGTGGVPGWGNEYRYVARYDRDLRGLGEYTYLKSVVEVWEGMSTQSRKCTSRDSRRWIPPWST